MTEQVLLDVRELRIAYHGRDGRTEGVAGIDFQLKAGEILAIVGESGSGKSTTAAALVGLLAGNAQIESGSIRLAGQELTTASERQWQSIRGRSVGFVPQDPASFPCEICFSVGDSMVGGQPSTNLRLVFVLPFQQGKYHPSKLASQHYQYLRGAISPCPLRLVKLFPCCSPASRHCCVM